MSEASKDPFNTYNRKYRKEHPEKVNQWRDQYAVNRLTKRGYTVTPPADKQETAQKEGAANA